MSWSRMGIIKVKGGMGFREFHCFNKAFLAKKLWRLWQTLNRLIAKIMKAKYYPNCQAIHAQLDNKPFLCLEKHT
jgi:hypothetical protein